MIGWLVLNPMKTMMIICRQWSASWTTYEITRRWIQQNTFIEQQHIRIMVVYNPAEQLKFQQNGWETYLSVEAMVHLETLQRCNLPCKVYCICEMCRELHTLLTQWTILLTEIINNSYWKTVQQIIWATSKAWWLLNIQRLLNYIYSIRFAHIRSIKNCVLRQYYLNDFNAPNTFSNNYIKLFDTICVYKVHPKKKLTW